MCCCCCCCWIRIISLTVLSVCAAWRLKARVGRTGMLRRVYAMRASSTNTEHCSLCFLHLTKQSQPPEGFIVIFSPQFVPGYSLLIVMGDNTFFKFDTTITIFEVDIAISISISIHFLLCHFFNTLKVKYHNTVSMFMTETAGVAPVWHSLVA